MAADPDDKHLPASVRTAYTCKKDPTGPLNRDSLINYINEEGIQAPDKGKSKSLLGLNENIDSLSQTRPSHSRRGSSAGRYSCPSTTTPSWPP